MATKRGALHPLLRCPIHAAFPKEERGRDRGRGDSIRRARFDPEIVGIALPGQLAQLKVEVR